MVKPYLRASGSRGWQGTKVQAPRDSHTVDKAITADSHAYTLYWFFKELPEGSRCGAAAVPRYDDDVPAYGSMSVGCLSVVLIVVDNGKREPALRFSPMYA